MSPNQYRALEIIVDLWDDGGYARPGRSTNRAAERVDRRTVDALARRGLVEVVTIDLTNEDAVRPIGNARELAHTRPGRPARR